MTANAMMHITAHDRRSFRYLGDVETVAIELAHEACSTHLVGARNVVADRLTVRFGRRRDFSVYSRVGSMA
jgi:hypothetical protein